MRKRLIAATAVIAAAATLLVASPATAAPARPMSACPNGGTELEAKGDSASSSPFKQASGTASRVSGDPGVTLGISTTRSFTMSGSIGSTTGISASAVVATVKQDYSVTISAGFTKTTTNSGAWTVPASYKNGGALAIGSLIHTGRVERWQLNTSCVPTTFLNSTSYEAPETGWHFKTYKL